MDKDEIALMLGHISGQLKGLDKRVASQGTKIDSIDSRLRHTEVSAAGTSAVVAAVVAVGTSLIAAAFKTKGV